MNDTDFEKFLEYKMFKMKAQAVSKAGIKIERMMEGEQEDKESGKEVNFYFPGLTPLCL